MTIPEVVGVRLSGELKDGSTATDLVLTVTETLRRHNVVGKFVEYFGPGVNNMSLPDRAMLSNMAPEYGATTGFFPVDNETINYLKLTNRGDKADLVEAYAKEQGLFREGVKDPEYSHVIDIDISKVVPSLSGPARPQDRIPLKDMKERFLEFIAQKQGNQINSKASSVFADESGHDKESNTCKIETTKKEVKININNEDMTITDGSVVIAAITSCTNTSSPAVMLGAGILAKNAVERGLAVKSYVKTSLAPGSRVVQEYLQRSGLLASLEALGFYAVGFGCTTCIGNSGPIHKGIEKAVNEEGLIVTSVLSGNRNFEARIHQSVKANYLASPILVVAYALAGRVDIDLTKEPLGAGKNGDPVFLADIWPSVDEIKKSIDSLLVPGIFKEKYSRVLEGDTHWQSLSFPSGDSFKWNEGSNYIKKPPFFDGFKLVPDKIMDIDRARSLLLLGDSVTTDHISPAGAIPSDYPAGQYLVNENVLPGDFNTYGSRRGNHEVMMRGTFANVRLKNRLVYPVEGGYTLKLPERERTYTYYAAMKYIQEGVPLIVFAGKEYGTGSSRDWAAKGTYLFGVRAVIAVSFERIHRSNLVGMGVLPLIFSDGLSWQDLHIDGAEEFRITGLKDISPRQVLKVEAIKDKGEITNFNVITGLDTDVEVQYFKNHGILPFVLRKLAKK
jgi:aconitate hydratase